MVDYKLKYLKYKKKYLNLLKLTGSGLASISLQEERNRMLRNINEYMTRRDLNVREAEETVLEAMRNVMGGHINATNMDEFLGEWIIPGNLTAEEFQETLAEKSDDKTRKEYILDLTRDVIFNELINRVGDRGVRVVMGWLARLDGVTGNNLQDFVIMKLPFLNPYINESNTHTHSDELPSRLPDISDDDNEIGVWDDDLRQRTFQPERIN